MHQMTMHAAQSRRQILPVETVGDHVVEWMTHVIPAITNGLLQL